jgi:hypothetical protein
MGVMTPRLSRVDCRYLGSIDTVRTPSLSSFRGLGMFIARAVALWCNAASFYASTKD